MTHIGEQSISQLGADDVVSTDHCVDHTPVCTVVQEQWGWGTAAIESASTVEHGLTVASMITIYSGQRTWSAAARGATVCVR
jgi:hypothetical protein